MHMTDKQRKLLILMAVDAVLTAEFKECNHTTEDETDYISDELADELGVVEMRNGLMQLYRETYTALKEQEQLLECNRQERAPRTHIPFTDLGTWEGTSYK